MPLLVKRLDPLRGYFTFSGLATGGLILGGLVGAAAIATVGPWLAMGLAIWSGQTTEPTLPALSYPWGWTAVAVAVWAAGTWREHHRAGGRLYPALSWGGGVAVALLPMVQLWRLLGESTL